MKVLPNSSNLLRHIDHYWIVNNEEEKLGCQQLYAYPGVSPELLIPLKGYLKYVDGTVSRSVYESTLFSFIDGPLFLDFSNAHCFIVVRFKPRGVASLLPFTDISANDLFQDKITTAACVFKQFSGITSVLKDSFLENAAIILDEFFSKVFMPNSVGFVSEMLTGERMNLTPREMMQVTGYSRSTLERRFKRETGLTPKTFQKLKRFRMVVDELCESKNRDWHHYIDKFNYFDQSHFIKEIKTFSYVTPRSISTDKTLFSYRS